MRAFELTVFLRMKFTLCVSVPQLPGKTVSVRTTDGFNTEKTAALYAPSVSTVSDC